MSDTPPARAHIISMNRRRAICRSATAMLAAISAIILAVTAIPAAAEQRPLTQDWLFQRTTFPRRVVAVIKAGTVAGPIAVDVEVDGLGTRHLQLNATSQ